MIIKFAFDALIGVPLTLSRQILEKIKDEVDRERLVTEESIKKRLQELQLLLEDGDIREDEYEKLEVELIGRLKKVREYHRSQGR